MAEVARPPHFSASIREELDRILSSPEFRTSKRSQDFLKYVVEHALTGQADLLKERTIGIEGFGPAQGLASGRIAIGAHQSWRGPQAAGTLLCRARGTRSGPH